MPANAAILAIGLGLAQPFRMDDRPKIERAASAHKARERARLSAALRENLKRRKAQAKSRAAAEALGDEGQREKPHDSAGIAEHKPGG